MFYRLAVNLPVKDQRGTVRTLTRSKHPLHYMLPDVTEDDEASFQSWISQNHIPFDPAPTSDYDLRGFYKAMVAGRNAKQAKNLHFPDTWKTPYHKTFSNESEYATTDAPRWEGDVLKDRSGKIVADHRENE